jgi:transglutaminase-like putative cysteine protease
VKTVRFKYQTELAFSSPASEHRFLLKILPQSDDRQQIVSLSWSVAPSPVDTLWRTVDGFGNDAVAGLINAPHDRFAFGLEGVAEVSGDPYISSDEPPRVFLYPTELTRPHHGLVDFHDCIDININDDTGNDGHCERSEAIRKVSTYKNRSASISERVKHFSHAVHTHLRYESGGTTNSTTASDAFDKGAGVCQDYAHILLALLRLDKIPCRYVAGLASDYGETHAWVEAWTGDRYIAIDPTRDKLIDEGYIALSRGRDFNDCSIERGVFKGTCRGTQKVSLNMDIS